jgi:RimJ/RimL family protein N-acetyltransferase
MRFTFPSTVITERLLLRPWRAADASVMKAAIDANLEHLRVWMPWAMDEPTPVEAIVARIEKFAAAHAAGEDAVFGIFARDGATAIGGAGLHPRVQDGVEIGYWVGTSHTRRGFATEATAALVQVAFERLAVEQVQIRCDPRNAPSAGIPRAGGPRDTMVWQLTRERWAAHEGGRSGT